MIEGHVGRSAAWKKERRSKGMGDEAERVPLVATTTSLAFYPRQWPMREERKGKKRERERMKENERKNE